MGAYRRHHSLAHGLPSEFSEFAPHLQENRPSRHDLAPLIGNQSEHLANTPSVNCAPIPEPVNFPEAPWDFLPQPTQGNTQNPTYFESQQAPIPANISTENCPSDVGHTDSLPAVQPAHTWFDPAQYNKIVDDDMVRYVHRTAGRVKRKETTHWQKLIRSRHDAHPNTPYHPFATEAQWKLGHWLATCKSSQSKIDEFLSMDGVLAETPAYGRASSLFDMVEDKLDGFGGPPWHTQRILPENFPEAEHEDLVMYLRDPEVCADYLLGRPDLAGQMTFAPEVIFAGEDKIQVINQMPTGRRWHRILKEARQDPDAALGGVLFGSDTTHLTHYAGDIKVHALYLSLGNINKETRAQTSKRAWILIAYIPICKWENTLEKTEIRSKSHEKALPGILSRRLFHFCMEIICEPFRELNVHEIVDPEGNVRLVFYVLFAYLADLEEQYMIAALDKSNCIHCLATTHDWSSPHHCPPRTGESILEAIEKVRTERNPNTDPYDFSLGANKYRLGDVEYPFWAGLPFVDICEALSVDLLHGFHKFFFDHPFKWNVNSLGEKEIDIRMKAQVPYSGSRVFSKGVTHITQMSMKEHRALETVHLGVIANSPVPFSRELTLATQSLLDFIYWAQLPSHTELTLKQFKLAYEGFHTHKQIWIKNGSRRGEAGVIEHFDIPKMHTAGHMAEQILDKGTADNFSTETIEHLHMDTLKEAFPATNKKEWEKQTIRWLVRREKLLEFLLFQTWRKALGEGEVPSSGVGMQGVGRDSGKDNVYSNRDILSESAPPAGPPQTAPRRPRGGFASMPLGNPTPPPPVESIAAPTGTTRKRKRQLDDVDNKEERTSKRIIQSQQAFGLRSLQDLALRPETLTMSALQEKYRLPNLLKECMASNKFPMSLCLDTVVEVWKSIRLQEPQRRFFHPVTWTRAQAYPATVKDPAVADPVLFLSREIDAGDEHLIRLHDCHVGRMQLIFRIAQTPESAASEVFAYIHTFLTIPTEPENATNMFVITKPARLRSQLVNISRIFRVCPLSPRFSGDAITGVTPQTTLDRYNTFYINKYYSMSDFLFLNGH